MLNSHNSSCILYKVNMFKSIAKLDEFLALHMFLHVLFFVTEESWKMNYSSNIQSINNIPSVRQDYILQQII